MSSAFAKDALRTVTHSLRRFLSIAAICALGTTMLIGLVIACEDLRLSADAFFDAQRLYDVSVQSTLGLTDEDVAALGALDGVEVAEGSWGETAYTSVNGARSSVEVHALMASGMNEPHVDEGRLPETADEVVVTPEYLEDTGKGIGDTVEFSGSGAAATEDVVEEGATPEETDAPSGTIEPIESLDGQDSATSDTPQAESGGETEEPDGTASSEEGEAATGADAEDEELFATHPYTIVGVVIDPMSTAAKNGSSSFRATGARYTFFVTADAATADAYSVVYLRVTGAAEEHGFSDAYEQLVSRVTSEAEAIKDAREQTRTEQLHTEATEKVNDAEADAESQLSDAESKLKDAQATIDDARAKVSSGREELARQERSADAQLDAAQKTLDESRGRLASAQAELDANERALDAAARQLPGGQAELDQSRAELEQARSDGERRIDQEVTEAWQNGPERADLTKRLGGLRAQEAELAAKLEDATAQAAPRIEGLEAERDALQARIEELEAAQTPETDATTPAPASPEGATAHDAAPTAEAPDASDELARLRARLDQVRAELAQLQAPLAELEASLAQVRSAADEVAGAIAQGDAAAAQQAQALKAQLAEQLAGQSAQLDQWADGLARISSGRAQLASGRQQVAAGLAELDRGQAELDARRGEAKDKIAAGERKLNDAAGEVVGGQLELDANRATYEREKADALAKIADARTDVQGIGEATWYIQDRSAISSYASIDSDASSIEVIGTVFPAIFLTVAILVSMTSATRMVEEERSLMGLYKALGYSRARIMSKYVAYTVGAAATGGLLGVVLGFVALPEFLFTVFRVMYTLPAFTLHFDPGLCALAVGMFVVGIAVATALTVRGELAEQPAALMRPRAPRAGTRILLERITPVWSRLSFLNKVTARNLFRYKRRLAMTVFGVAGCCALMIAGFAIADTVLALSPNQYGGEGRQGVYEYDLMAVTKPQDLSSAATKLTASGEVKNYAAIRMENVTVEHEGAKETVQLVVVPDGFSLEGFIDLRTQSGEHLGLARATAGTDGTPGTDDDGVLATKNASTVLGFGAGDQLTLRDTTLHEAQVTVDDVVMNYLGNAVYLTQATYERAFGVTLEANALLAHLDGGADAQISFADKLASDPTFLSVTSIQEGIRDFTANFMLINYVVALITALAAGLSFVVLFTLSSTNISERERELATIKVLGFRRGEVRTYVNKELLILAGIGTLVGIPVGTLLGHALTYVLNMPSMYFAVEISPLSYVWSCALSMLFAVVVCLISNRSLDRIDMVGALKSAE